MPQELDERVIQDLEQAATEHLAWLKRVHLALLFGDGVPEAPAALPATVETMARRGRGGGAGACANRQEALAKLCRLRRRMQDEAVHLSAKARGGEGLGADEYLSFMATVEAYDHQARLVGSMLRQALAETDPLTGVHNRQGMLRDLEREWTRAQRTGQPCCLAIADLDHFKTINDTYGHPAGDQVLRAAARFFVRRLRSYDTVYRYGGEEFLFLLPNTDNETARRVLDRLRTLMARLPVSLADGTRITITVSIGLAAMSAEDGPEQAIARADEACYRAKHEGRNRVCVATEEPRPAPVSTFGAAMPVPFGRSFPPFPSINPLLPCRGNGSDEAAPR
ncbi:MAG: diguanylate cyclase [Alphaproteobacteria bacterium]|nr:diguanylate cyclase [Alphaproteobacteria bacterium]